MDINIPAHILGYEAVKYIAQKKPEATVLLGSRSTKNGEDAIAKMKSSVQGFDFSNVKVIEVDITDAASLKAAVEHIKSTYTTLDVLLHNSGISNLNGDWKHPAIFDVNIRGAKASVEAFLPLIPKGGIVDVVSSEVGPWYMSELDSSERAKLDITDAKWDQIEAWMDDWEAFADGKPSDVKWVSLETGVVGSKYCASKAILNPWIRTFARTHPDIRTVVTCPGYCATDLNNNQGTRPASVGGESVAWPLFNDFESGAFYQDGIKKAFGSYAPPK